MVKNIIFDLSEVIITGYHNIQYLIEKETDIPAKEFKDKKNQTEDIFLDTMRGKYSENEYCDMLLDGTNWNLTRKQLKEIIRKNLNNPIEGTSSVIKKLKNKYNIILLSDHVREWVEYILDNNELLQIFEHKYFSFEFGKLKTDDGCFQFILDDMKIDPKETIFIDDLEENVELANKLGIKGIIFKNAKQLENELIKRKIVNSILS